MIQSLVTLCINSQIQGLSKRMNRALAFRVAPWEGTGCKSMAKTLCSLMLIASRDLEEQYVLLSV
jgi:hypothetical protein